MTNLQPSETEKTQAQKDLIAMYEELYEGIVHEKYPEAFLNSDWYNGPTAPAERNKISFMHYMKDGKAQELLERYGDACAVTRTYTGLVSYGNLLVAMTHPQVIDHNNLRQLQHSVKSVIELDCNNSETYEQIDAMASPDNIRIAANPRGKELVEDVLNRAGFASRAVQRAEHAHKAAADKSSRNAGGDDEAKGDKQHRFKQKAHPRINASDSNEAGIA